MLEILLFGAAFLTFYAYFGYPVTLFLLSLVRNRDVNREPFKSSVTMIITVHNEEKRIRKKLENTLFLQYSGKKPQIIVASDASTDQTNTIAKGFQEQGVELIEITEHKGKEYAQKLAVQQAKGDIIVFSDVAAMLDADGLAQILSNFADPTVGCVSSEDRLIGKDGKESGEGLYVRYEMWLRRFESRVNSLVGLSGSYFAARKKVCDDFSGEMQSDFRTLLSSIKLGLRGVSDPRAIGYYEDVADEKREFERKVRTVIRGLTVFFQHLEFLNVSKYGLFSYQYFCHKLLRWLVPMFLISCLLANFILAFGSLTYFILLLSQLAFYGSAIWGFKIGHEGRSYLKIPTYFLVVNFSILVAWWRYLRGQRMVRWVPTAR